MYETQAVMYINYISKSPIHIDVVEKHHAKMNKKDPFAPYHYETYTTSEVTITNIQLFLNIIQFLSIFFLIKYNMYT